MKNGTYRNKKREMSSHEEAGRMYPNRARPKEWNATNEKIWKKRILQYKSCHTCCYAGYTWRVNMPGWDWSVIRDIVEVIAAKDKYGTILEFTCWKRKGYECSLPESNICRKWKEADNAIDRIEIYAKLGTDDFKKAAKILERRLRDSKKK
jgi:hypothetical protein